MWFHVFLCFMSRESLVCPSRQQFPLRTLLSALLTPVSSQILYAAVPTVLKRSCRRKLCPPWDPTAAISLIAFPTSSPKSCRNPTQSSSSFSLKELKLDWMSLPSANVPDPQINGHVIMMSTSEACTTSADVTPGILLKLWVHKQKTCFWILWYLELRCRCKCKWRVYFCSAFTLIYLRWMSKHPFLLPRLKTISENDFKIKASNKLHLL